MIKPFAAVLTKITPVEVAPALRMIVYVLGLFALALWIAHAFETSIRDTVASYPRLGVLVFVVTGIIAVLIPVLTNLPLVPIAVVAWGSLTTALLLLAGWVAGSAISFLLGRHAGPVILRHFPSINRHAQIDRLIDPDHPIGSLVLLRMTFPVDILSYALGFFSRRATLSETTLSTAIGGAPFAVMFALFPLLSASAQLGVFVASLLVFVVYARWVYRKNGPRHTGDRF